MKNLMWIVPLALFGVVLIISLAIVAPYNIYKNQQQEINELRKKLADYGTGTTDIKQDIRTFLESVNPEILQEIDARKPNIRVFINTLNQVELMSLSKRPDFNKFLKYKRGDKVSRSSKWGPKHEGFIFDLDEKGEMNGYDFYPKDALIK